MCVVALLNLYYLASEEEISDFEQEFNAATKHLPSILSNVASPDLLYFYARYKQVEIVMNELQINPTLLNSTYLHCQMTGFISIRFQKI